MNKNEPIIATCGEVAVLVDYSTKDWKKIRCIGSLYLVGTERSLLKILPPPGIRPSNGYRTEISVSADVDYSVMMEVRQLNGDRRVITIWRQTKPEEPIHWTFSNSADKDVGPHKLIMYPDLERLLNYLLEAK